MSDINSHSMLPMSVINSVYATLLWTRMPVSTVSITFVGFRHDNRRRNQFRSLTFTRRPFRRCTRWLMSRWWRSSGRLLWSANVIWWWRRFPNIRGRCVSCQHPAVGTTVLIMTWTTVSSRAAVIFRSTSNNCHRTATQTSSSTKASENSLFTTQPRKMAICWLCTCSALQISGCSLMVKAMPSLTWWTLGHFHCSLPSATAMGGIIKGKGG